MGFRRIWLDFQLISLGFGLKDPWCPHSSSRWKTAPALFQPLEEPLNVLSPPACRPRPPASSSPRSFQGRLGAGSSISGCSQRLVQGLCGQSGGLYRKQTLCNSSPHTKGLCKGCARPTRKGCEPRKTAQNSLCTGCARVVRGYFSMGFFFNAKQY